MDVPEDLDVGNPSIVVQLQIPQCVDNFVGLRLAVGLDDHRDDADLPVVGHGFAAADRQDVELEGLDELGCILARSPTDP